MQPWVVSESTESVDVEIGLTFVPNINTCKVMIILMSDVATNLLINMIA